MSSYHSSFSYLNKNSIDEGLLIAAFEPDNDFVDSFLSMDSIYTESADGTHRYMYGTKYNSVATINITFIKRDGSDFSVAENRQIFRWLTGARTNSWLDLHENDAEIDVYGKRVAAYSFFGHFSDVQQRKMDAKVVGFQATFESIHPWAYSAPCHVQAVIGDRMIGIDSSGVINGGESHPELGLDPKTGFLSNDRAGVFKPFQITDTGVVYNDYYSIVPLENDTDDLYTYTNLDIKYVNRTSNCLIIHNKSLGEQTKVDNLVDNEKITISASQFIVSDMPNKIFGDDFNFVFPKLCPGHNELIIDGKGKGSIEFTYRYPIKIGDCAINIDNIVGKCD